MLGIYDHAKMLWAAGKLLTVSKSLNDNKPDRMSNEIVICAAVKIGGQLFRGNRSSDCVLSARNLLGKGIRVMRDNQGFITSTGRFVSRKDAYDLQIAAGIPSAQGSYSIPGTLYSEDLY